MEGKLTFSIQGKYNFEIDIYRTEMNGQEQMTLNPTFPFCFYGSEGQANGLKTTHVKKYRESYCNAFQTTFNEVGICHTINNVEQGFAL